LLPIYENKTESYFSFWQTRRFIVKLQLLKNLPLRYKFVAIAFIGMILIALTLGLANKLSSESTENRFNQQLISIQDRLWQRMIKTQFEQLEMATTTLRREQQIPRALSEQNDELIIERGDDVYERLHGAQILQHLQITNTKAELKYRSDTGNNKTSKMNVVQTALKNKKISKDIEITGNNELSNLVAFPLFSQGKLVGTGVFIQSLQNAVEIFAKENQLETYIVSPQNKLLHSTNTELYKDISPALPNIAESSISRYESAGNYFSVATQPIINLSNQPIAYLVTMRDITKTYLSERNSQYIVYILVSIGILLIAAAFSYFIFYSLRPLNELLEVVHKMHAGDTSARMVVKHDDEIGELGTSFNKMADEMVDTLNNEMISKEELEGKIDLLHITVQQIAKGDLSAQMMVFSGNESIDQLAKSVQSMIDSLNEIVSHVQHSGIKVASSTNEIAATAKEQEATVTEQAATTNQIMATATQISATSRELASTMHEVSEVAVQTTISANDGQEALSKMESTMMLMNNATASITSKLAVLSEKAANINTVVTTITKVADQTNLLSLNAAIEAEKAGEYGLGFAVVATEIRRLADQTAVATWDIEQMVKEMQSAVSAGVMGMDKFSEEVTRGVNEVRQIGGQLAQIIEEVQTLTPRFDSVNEGMQSQSHGAQQISDSMIQLNEATQQTVISLQQSNVSVDTLNEAANSLQDAVSQFRIK